MSTKRKDKQEIEWKAEQKWYDRTFQHKSVVRPAISAIDERDTVLFRQRKEIVRLRKKIAQLKELLEADCFKCGLQNAQEDLLDDIVNVEPGPGAILPKHDHDLYESLKAETIAVGFMARFKNALRALAVWKKESE